MAIIGFTKLETFFRKVASLDIEKGHVKEITDIVEKKLLDFLVAAERNANLNGRDVIWEADLPITKGMQESMIEVKKLEEEVEVEDVLDYLTTVPPLKYPLAADLEAKLPNLTGAIVLVMARIMKEMETESRRVNHEMIERAGHIMDLTL